MNLFPFPEKREGQDEMYRRVSKTIEESSNIVVHAPTGIGKTAAALTPAFEKIKEGEIERVIFVTPRNSQHKIAIETLRSINEKHNENLTGVDLIGKQWMCNLEESEDMSSNKFSQYCSNLIDSRNCPFYSEMYNEEGKMEDNSFKRIKELTGSARTAAEMKEATANLCPYYLSVEMLSEADLIVADYLHVFSDGIWDSISGRSGISLENTVLVVDEAHNLPERARSILSFSLSKPQLDKAKTEAENFGYYDNKETLERISQLVQKISMNQLGQKNNEARIERKLLYDSLENDKSLDEILADFSSQAEEVREEQDESELTPIIEFLDAWSRQEESLLRLVKRVRTGSGRYLTLKISSLDSSELTKDTFKRTKANVLMSGTLKPQKMYQDLLGLEEATRETFESPFPEKNRTDLFVPTVTTRYKKRDDEMFDKISWYIAKTLSKIPHNSAVFFPSYSMLEKIKGRTEDRLDKRIIAEKQKMTSEEKNNLAAQLKDDDEKKVLYAVVSGSMGEGIDYPGEMLKATIIVGLPLRTPDLETKQLVSYLDQKTGKGSEYVYDNPAINKVMQASGRCIRSKEDRGFILYLDERYGWNKYSKIFPENMRPSETMAPWTDAQEFFDE